MVSFNPACYLPSAANSYLPNAIACPPPPSYLTSAYNVLTSPFSSTYATIGATLDAIGGLPFLSFLLIPTYGGYSTSLNLLFFYLTWSTLVLSHPPLKVELIATLTVRILFYIGPSVFFLLCDILIPSAAVNLKALGTSGLPFKDASRKRTLKLLKIVSWSLANILLTTLLQTAIELLFTRVLLIRSALRVSTNIPTPFTILKGVAKGYLLREALAYTIHRYVLHNRRHSRTLTSYHENWYHSIDAPFPLSASYDHPVTYILRSFIPTYAPAVLFRFHLLTYILYLTIISIEELFSYSGYSTVPTNFILGGFARRTDNHLLCGGEGNYGCWGLVDWIMGTSVGADLGDDMEAEAEKHDVQGKAERTARGLRKRIEGKTNGNGSGGKSGVRRRRRDS